MSISGSYYGRSLFTIILERDQNCQALDEHVPEAELEVHPELAAKLSIVDGERIRLSPAGQY